MVRKESLTYFTYQARAGLLILGGVTSESLTILQVGLLVKLGMFPFHSWVVPVLYANTVPVILTLLFPRKLPLFFYASGKFTICVACLTILAGSLMAIFQRRILKTLIYSRITTTGILVLCMEFEVFHSYFWFYIISFSLVLLQHSDSGMLLNIGLINLIGFPPIPIFFAKLKLLRCALTEISFLILVFSVLSMATYYYGKLIKIP